MRRSPRWTGFGGAVSVARCAGSEAQSTSVAPPRCVGGLSDRWSPLSSGAKLAVVGRVAYPGFRDRLARCNLSAIVRLVAVRMLAVDSSTSSVPPQGADVACDRSPTPPLVQATPAQILLVPMLDTPSGNTPAVRRSQSR